MTETRLCREAGVALLRVSGQDARRFLHLQTTQRLDDLTADTTRLAAWLTPQGRVRALFDVVPAPDGVWLLLPEDLADTVATGLGRFVLRSAVRIERPVDHRLGTAIGKVDAWLGDAGIRLATGGVASADGLVLARTSPTRVEMIAARDASPALLAGLEPADRAAVEREAIARGRPAVTAATSERHIPQMLDLDRQGAVSFNKGCYPGQEIVARTQNLGTVKRRLGRFGLGAGESTPPGAPPAPGDAIVDAAGADCGEIDRVAADGTGVELLAVVMLTADRNTLRLAADGRALRPLGLPWD